VRETDFEAYGDIPFTPTGLLTLRKETRYQANRVGKLHNPFLWLEFIKLGLLFYAERTKDNQLQV
jgi:hypothetical protein